jgi:hypothetical protein
MDRFHYLWVQVKAFISSRWLPTDDVMSCYSFVNSPLPSGPHTHGEGLVHFKMPSEPLPSVYSLVQSHTISDEMCLSLHPDSDGSISTTRNKLYLTYKKGSRQNSLQTFNPWVIPLFHNNGTPARSQCNLGLLKDVVILFSKAHPLIIQVTTPGPAFPGNILPFTPHLASGDHQHGLRRILKKNTSGEMTGWKQRCASGNKNGVPGSPWESQTHNKLWTNTSAIVVIIWSNCGLSH